MEDCVFVGEGVVDGWVEIEKARGTDGLFGARWNGNTGT